MHKDLLAPPPIELPAEELVDAASPIEAVLANPASPSCWATLALGRLEEASSDEEKAIAYAFARTGYHRSLDRLRANGWRGHGPIPFAHEPNQGVLRAIASLALASELIGDNEEFERCKKLLEDSDAGCVEKLLGAR
ncbi:DUF3151 domain-containing protein [Corynebacterium sp. SCR221107]|uniref:DUF3151 domain-containing protein n=1 Tax=Corynebacterium sp. SCR221107 TaxID=3017361 RepID=UPI0022EC6F29|nr:DUF3151 domain-containing protein [Corynebacterium sp. SCR221107]WBT09316.1 DUF3151 domain-containing protein [Corynebacterium sp. SCR221107]